ncbi:enoyl-CoA hydratase-related protein [Conexibacter sp. JD483]|uniref:enoyl-CoA hydratase/isomerase family protein n=1 Tax=unclassified Conexibacter TaxID=2627773 RepID=UPI0027168CC1|nr:MULTISPECIES: enoyl-CoA hydratase-related protein [unclassified Conexibacter]MDO8189427.1 enoyl-CoA hydratase-related protein [Conexibacter sp. CPCC 205706]MDO8200761.1 enoyl-CoA hydratase-related protein [Conexibacter sp. CPCC 205762]MDR9372524.1 enoyl-CoA hydratase-related protein [Conexibacter sp. JD483]
MAPSAGAWSTLQVVRDGHTVVVTLNRPERRNALDATMMSELDALWSGHGLLDGARCIVVTGAGPGFCAGADVSLLASDREPNASFEDELAFLPGRRLPIPVIAAINGVCAGGGLHFVADADIVIASETASFLDPHVTMGQVTALEPLTLRLRMRPDALMRLALLGRDERLDAPAARAAGLVSEVVAPDALLDRALTLARQIEAGSPAAIRASRAALRRFEDELLDRHLQAGWEAIVAHWSHPDAKEGPAAFGERRAPRWEEA